MAVPVIRRVGGLEFSGRCPARHGKVIRRVGGLECDAPGFRGRRPVIRRVGGLEYPRSPAVISN